MRCWLNFDGVGLEGRSELRPLLGRLGREQRTPEVGDQREPNTGREARWWCPELVWFDSPFLTSSLGVAP